MKSNIINKDIEEIEDEFNDYLHSLSGKNILITGGNGFIGSYIVDVFADFNKEIENPFNLIVMNRNEINEKSRLYHLINDKNIKFIAQDVGKPFELSKGINIIFHAASVASPASFLKNPIDTIDSNVNGTRTLLNYSKENIVDNFLFFSSADVYGNPDKNFIPTPETYAGNVDSLNPRSCYSESKRFSETLCSTFFSKYNVPTKILRIGHTYGPGLREDKATREFFYKSINYKEINLKDSGKASISFCYVSDAIRGILRVMSNGKSGEAYNISSGFPATSIKDLASLVAKVENNNTSVNPNYSKENDNSHEYVRHLDISKLRKLGFEPKINLEEGISRLKQHYDEVGF
jgi:UDP-glucuronate decarboxylase